MGSETSDCWIETGVLWGLLQVRFTPYEHALKVARLSWRRTVLSRDRAGSTDTVHIEVFLKLSLQQNQGATKGRIPVRFGEVFARELREFQPAIEDRAQEFAFLIL